MTVEAPVRSLREPLREPDGCVVVGGGVSGVAAALAAADLGWRPVLLERRRVLGGMARSHAVGGGDDELDCGQHVILACCAGYRSLLRRLGTDHLVPLQPRLSVAVVDEGGRRATLGESALPAPLHLSASLSRLPFLGTRDRLAIAGAVARLLATGGDLRRLDGASFARWLGAAADGPSRRAFWNLVTVATCNLDVTRVSAAVAAFVMREGFLLRRGAAAIGVPAAPLSRLLEPAQRRLAAAGGAVRLCDAAAALEREGDRVTGVRTATGEVLRAGRVVVAGPPALLARLAPDLAEHPALAPAQGLQTSPIVNLILEYDRPVLDAALVAVWDSPLQWLFSRTRAHGRGGPDETVVCSLSAADDLVGLPSEEVLERLLPHLHRAQRATGRARLTGWRVTRERHATAALAPGSAARRLGPGTPVRGLALAGSWTATGWPITMESAALSGEAAVAALAAVPDAVRSRP